MDINRKKSAWAAVSVLTLETYDFVLFLFLIKTLQSVFPAERVGKFTIGLDLLFGLLARPLAGLFLAPLADRYGRKHLLMVTAFLMGIFTLLFASVPLQLCRSFFDRL